MVLVFIPGHPPYYIAAASLIAKAYSNSMMAVLNSRVRVISNGSEFGVPLWNESAQRGGSNSSIGMAQSIVFRRESDTGFSSSRVVDTAL